jgi:hypothetical protein
MRYQVWYGYSIKRFDDYLVARRFADTVNGIVIDDEDNSLAR